MSAQSKEGRIDEELKRVFRRHKVCSLAEPRDSRKEGRIRRNVLSVAAFPSHCSNMQ